MPLTPAKPKGSEARHLLAMSGIAAVSIEFSDTTRCRSASGSPRTSRYDRHAGGLLGSRSASGMDRLHVRFRIARAGGGTSGDSFRDPLHVAGVEDDVERPEVFVDTTRALGSRDRDDVGALGEQPRERELSGPAAFVLGDPLDAPDELGILRQVLGIEPRMHAAAVVGREVVQAVDRAGEEASPERRVRDECDAELATDGERFFGLAPIEKRELTLQRRDRMNAVGPANGLGAASERPIARTLPRSTSFAIAPTVSSIGTLGSTRCCEKRSISSTPSRLRLASHAWRTYSGRPLMPLGFPSMRTMPNFVVTSTWLRRPPIARPNSSSLWPQPYMSDESRKLMPRSIAWWMTVIESASSNLPYAPDIDIRPRPMAEARRLL